MDINQFCQSCAEQCNIQASLGNREYFVFEIGNNLSNTILFVVIFIAVALVIRQVIRYRRMYIEDAKHKKHLEEMKNKKDKDSKK
jgi:hypothetical protein